MTNIDEFRARIATLQVRRDELLAGTPSHAEMRAALTRYLTPTVDERRRVIAYHLIAEPAAALKVRVSPSGEVDLAPLLGLLLGVPTVVKALAGTLEGMFPDTLGAADRIAALKDIEVQLRKFEINEEVEVCRLEAEGASVVRRRDARPEIVLALPEDTAS